MHPKYDETVERLKTVAQRETGIHAVVILGSQVREDAPGDEWSDLDVLLLVDNPRFFLQTGAWLGSLGEIVCGIVEETNLEWLHLTWSVRRVLLADNRALDFSILPYERVDDVLSINAEVHANGYQVIYEDCPNQVAAKIEATLATLQEAPPHIPTAEDLWRTIESLLFQVVFAGKKIKRHELWVAVSCINQQANARLLDLIEFHTASVVAASQRIRYEGRFLERRIAPPLVEELSACFARYETQDAMRTLYHLLDLSRGLAREICEKQGYPFKASLFDQVRTLLDEVFGDRA